MDARVLLLLSCSLFVCSHPARHIFFSPLHRERSGVLRRWHDLLLEHQELLARVMTAECGKPLAEARGEVLYATAFFEWFAEEAKRGYGTVVPPNAPGRRLARTPRRPRSWPTAPPGSRSAPGPTW